MPCHRVVLRVGLTGEVERTSSKDVEATLREVGDSHRVPDRVGRWFLFWIRGDNWSWNRNVHQM